MLFLSFDHTFILYPIRNSFEIKNTNTQISNTETIRLQNIVIFWRALYFIVGSSLYSYGTNVKGSGGNMMHEKQRRMIVHKSIAQSRPKYRRPVLTF